MEDKGDLQGQDKPMAREKRAIELGISCLPDQPSCPPDHAIARSSDPTSFSPVRQIPRPDDSTQCRECLAALAHRFAQPMTALRGGMELVLMGKRTVADYRAVIEQSMHLADEMSQLITSLRCLGESAAPSGAPQCILLEETTRETVAELEPLAQCRELHLQLNAGGPLRVCANPERLREALQSLLAWVIQNSAGGGVIGLELLATDSEALLVLSPPRLDLQYLQIKVLEDITNPGLLFSHAARTGALGWAINQRLLEGLGASVEILTEGEEAGDIRVRFPLATGAVGEKPS